jgi:integrase
MFQRVRPRFKNALKSAKPGAYGDGDGLMLVVSEARSRKWILRFQSAGRRRDMGLGSYPEVGLAEARQQATAARISARNGIDPIKARRQSVKSAKPIPTFAEIAALVIADAKSKSSNEKVKYQWDRHLGESYAGPLLAKAVNAISTIDVANVLRPIWRSKPEVARKTYPAIRRVFEHARIILCDQHGIAMTGNPASWADLKAMGFEAPAKLSRGHQPSLPYSRMGAFVVTLRKRDAIAARALEFLILTNVRTDAVLSARWINIDTTAKVWTVPLANLKDCKPRAEGFRVPLAARALAILKEMAEARTCEYVFRVNASANRFQTCRC